jgi:hypothetical protein
MLMMPTGGTDIQAERSGESIGAAEAACPGPDQGLRCAFENVSVFLKAPQVSLEQVKRSLSIPRIDARSPQTDYAAFLLLYDAPPLGRRAPRRREDHIRNPFIQMTRSGRKTDAGPNLRKNWATEDHVHTRIAANIAKLPGLPPFHRKYGVWRAGYWALRRR